MNYALSQIAVLARVAICGPFSLGGTVIDDPCLVCGHPGPSETAHWPRTRRYGNAFVPLCRICHDAQHWGRAEVVEALIARAPGYWKREGLWELFEEEYTSWCEKRRYRELVR